MTFTVTINDPIHELAWKWADWIFAECKPAVPKQTRGGVYQVEIPAELAGDLYLRLMDLSPGDISVRVS